MSTPSKLSRRALLRGLSAFSLAPLFPAGALASSPAAASSRVALIIGNSKYRALPPLRNPANDAAGLGSRLAEMGFAVTAELDAGKGQFEAAVREFCARVAKERSVGLFYFSGHGVQLNWRNFMVPVDAKLASAEDVGAQAVDLNTVLEGLRRAAGPMNIVILDACRDNPFAQGFRTGQGLSQIDAPVGTFLAYATAPGNTASDGEGKNGLYTEQLLKEVRAPESKIEDVFKRVRLNVRRASKGRQVPWESTSLEGDFYFLPPAKKAEASREELDRQYAEDLAAWQKVEGIAGLEGYLRRYPSGHFAELAQARLDRLLAEQGEIKARIVSSQANPFTKGTALADMEYRVGDAYEFRTVDMYTDRERSRSRQVVTGLMGGEVVYNQGRPITDLLGNPRVTPDGKRQVDTQVFPAEYALGKKWSTRIGITRPGGFTEEVRLDLAVTARETIEVLAGRFEAFRVEASGWGMKTGRREFRYWMAPDRVRRILLREQHTWDTRRDRNAAPEQTRIELVSFSEAGRAAPPSPSS